MAVASSSFFHSSYNCLSRSVVFDCEYPFSRLLLSLSYIVHLTILWNYWMRLRMIDIWRIISSAEAQPKPIRWITPSETSMILQIRAYAIYWLLQNRIYHHDNIFEWICFHMDFHAHLNLNDLLLFVFRSFQLFVM